MEIVNINPYALGVKGGVEVHLTYQTERLRELGHGVVNLVGSGGKDKFEAFDQLKDPFFSMGTEEEDFTETHKDIVAAADEVHLHNLHTLDSRKYRVLCEFLRRNVPKSRVYLHAHNFNGTSSERDAVSSFFGYEVFVYSDFMRRIIGSECDRSSTILPYFFPVKQPSEQKPYDEEVTFIQPTRFNKMKGSHISLSVIAALLSEGRQINFVHAGFNWSNYKRSLDDIFSGMSVQQQKSIMEWINDGRIILNSFGYEELLDEIEDSNVVLLPTTTTGLQGEPFGIAAFQSIALQKFVIASDSGNYRSLFGDTGYTHSIQTTAGSETGLYNAVTESLAKRNNEMKDEELEWVKNYLERYLTAREASLGRYR